MYELCVDTRESDLLVKIPDLLQSTKLHAFLRMTSEPLHIGDIELRSDTGNLLCVFERKSLTDLASSIVDGRYKEQSLRLKKACSLPDSAKYYILEGDLQKFKGRKSKGRMVSKPALYGAITSLTYGKGFQVLKTSCLNETAELLVRFADKVRRIDMDNAKLLLQSQQSQDKQDTMSENSENSEPDAKTIDSPTSPNSPNSPNSQKSSSMNSNSNSDSDDYSQVVKKVKHKNITPSNIGVICLSQVPYVSTTIANVLIDHYGDLRTCINSIHKDPSDLQTLRVNGRKMSSRVIQNLLYYFSPPPEEE